MLYIIQSSLLWLVLLSITSFDNSTYPFINDEETIETMLSHYIFTIYVHFTLSINICVNAFIFLLLDISKDKTNGGPIQLILMKIKRFRRYSLYIIDILILFYILKMFIQNLKKIKPFYMYYIINW